VGGAPSLALLADAGDAECETPRGDAATEVAPEPAAKTAWPGGEDDEDEAEEEDEDAFGEDASGLGEMHGDPCHICNTVSFVVLGSVLHVSGGCAIIELTRRGTCCNSCG
jgi:hypothetical protein